MKFTIFGAGVIFACIVLALVKSGDSKAMAQCQQTHSYDTCFQLLNR